MSGERSTHDSSFPSLTPLSLFPSLSPFPPFVTINITVYRACHFLYIDSHSPSTPHKLPLTTYFLLVNLPSLPLFHPFIPPRYFPPLHSLPLTSSLFTLLLSISFTFPFLSPLSFLFYLHLSDPLVPLTAIFHIYTAL